MEFNLSKRILALILVLAALFVIWKVVKYSGLSPDSNLYQVVLVQNDQVFYGKLHKIHSDYPYLTDVYYLNPQQPELDKRGRPTGTSKFTVIKRGIDEIHAPTDKMYIPRESIIYWENVGANSRVAQGIKADKELRARSR